MQSFIQTYTSMKQKFNGRLTRMENDILQKLNAPLDSIISAQEIILCILLKVPQQIWLSNVCNASLLKTFISHSLQKSYSVLGQQQNLIQLKNS